MQFSCYRDNLQRQAFEMKESTNDILHSFTKEARFGLGIYSSIIVQFDCYQTNVLRQAFEMRECNNDILHSFTKRLGLVWEYTVV